MYSFLLALIYIAFISLGLPDSLLGSGWPVVHLELGVPISYMGIVSMAISGGTIVSSLMSDRLNRKLGTRIVTVISVFLTVIALFGFSFSSRFWMLIVFAVPYGLGAGAIDAALNNYVALHYKAKHMSWLHSFWGVGTIVSPFIMGYALTNKTWNSGCRIVGAIQLAIAILLLVTLPVWKVNKSADETEKKSVGLVSALKIKGVPFLLIGFFAYCAAETTAMQWASTYFVEVKGISAERAATFASLFYIGITVGRFISGFITDKLGDRNDNNGNDDSPLRRMLPVRADEFLFSRRRGIRCDRSRLRADISVHHSLHAEQLRGGELRRYNRNTDGERLCRDMPDAAALWPARRIYRGLAAAGVHRRAACADGGNVRAP